ncbi:MAG: D-alanine--D-alanine ligase [Verrucomicrobiota bacterium]
MSLKKIAVFKGGPSKEREVSLRTGGAIADALRTKGYSVEEVDIQGPDFSISSDVDFVFIALHGTFGEDGQIQSILDQRQIKYTGCGTHASALAFDKEKSKECFKIYQVPTPQGESLRHGEKTSLRAPLVFKPACEGSSIGLEMVHQDDQIDAAFHRACQHGKIILAEKMIQGRELTVGILNGEALPIVEIRPKTGTYDYQNKYTAGCTEYVCPALLSEKTTQAVQSAAVKAYHALGCEVYARVDVLIDANETPWVLEVNTIPGMTATSLLPKAAKAVGMEFPELCEKILLFSEQKYRRNE